MTSRFDLPLNVAGASADYSACSFFLSMSGEPPPAAVGKSIDSPVALSWPFKYRFSHQLPSCQSWKRLLYGIATVRNWLPLRKRPFRESRGVQVHWSWSSVTPVSLWSDVDTFEPGLVNRPLHKPGPLRFHDDVSKRAVSGRGSPRRQGRRVATGRPRTRNNA